MTERLDASRTAESNVRRKGRSIVSSVERSRSMKTNGISVRIVEVMVLQRNNNCEVMVSRWCRTRLRERYRIVSVRVKTCHPALFKVQTEEMARQLSDMAHEGGGSRTIAN